MATQGVKRQTGLSLVGLIFLLAIGGLIAVLALRVVPSVSEFLAVKKAIVKAKADGTTPAEIRASFDRQADVGYIESLTGKDLDISSVNGEVEVSFAYDKKIPLVGPASLLIEYQGSTARATRSNKTRVP